MLEGVFDRKDRTRKSLLDEAISLEDNIVNGNRSDFVSSYYHRRRPIILSWASCADEAEGGLYVSNNKDD